MRRDFSPQDATEPGSNQLAAISALVGGASVTEAAERAGVDRTTLHRWMSGDAAFVATLNRTKLEVLDEIRAELRSTAGSAARVVRELVTNPKTPPAVRLRAALALLESVGGLTPEPLGPTTVDAVETRWMEDQRAADLLRLLASA